MGYFSYVYIYERYMVSFDKFDSHTASHCDKLQHALQHFAAYLSDELKLMAFLTREPLGSFECCWGSFEC